MLKQLIPSLVIGTNLALFVAPLSAVADTYNFTVTNDTDYAITELYVDDAEEEEWGEDVMEGETVEPGETASFSWADEDVEEGDPCMYHVKAVFSDDEIAEEVEDGIDFCENPDVVVSEG